MYMFLSGMLLGTCCKRGSMRIDLEATVSKTSQMLNPVQSCEIMSFHARSNQIRKLPHATHLSPRIT